MNTPVNIIVLGTRQVMRDMLIGLVVKHCMAWQIHPACKISSARALLERIPCDCIITDLQTPDGDVIQFLHTLRENGMNLPVVVVADSDHVVQKLHAKGIDVQHILSESCHSEELLRSMYDCLKDHNLRHIPVNKESKHKKKHRSSHGSVILFPGVSSVTPVLPNMLEMDRQLTLLDRLLKLHSLESNVAGICASAARITLDITRAKHSFIALMEQDERFLIAGHATAVSTPNPFSTLADSCAIADTPFHTLLNRDSHQQKYISGDAPCWPRLTKAQYFAMPITLQIHPVGVLCVIAPEQGIHIASMQMRMLEHLVREMDTMLDNRATHAALRSSVHESLIAMVRALEARDGYTKDHSARVSGIGSRIARNLGLERERVQIVRTGGLLHDIGKIGIPDSILLKPDTYLEDEYEAMKMHPIIGDQLLMPIGMLADERLVVRHHHERWDGSGYPDGLAGENIPLVARIIAVADAIDAMTSHRIYRQAQPVSFCLEQLQSAAGSQFDPMVAKAAAKALRLGRIKTMNPAYPYPPGYDHDMQANAL